MATPKCPDCGSREVTTKSKYETLRVGVGKNQVLRRIAVPVRRCSKCRLQYTDEEGERIRERSAMSILKGRPKR